MNTTKELHWRGIEYANCITCSGVTPHVPQKGCPEYDTIQQQGFSSGILKRVEYPFIAITHRSLWPGVVEFLGSQQRVK